MVDAAGILIKCALREAPTFVLGDYKPAPRRLQRQMMYMKSRRVKFKMVFDGCATPEKNPERLRREERRVKFKTDLEKKNAGWSISQTC